jgi:hypothetical protein
MVKEKGTPPCFFSGKNKKNKKFFSRGGAYLSGKKNIFFSYLYIYDQNSHQIQF